MSPTLRIPFVKASACGNDFLLIDSSSVIDSLRVRDALASADLHAITRQICDRHNGIGADGVEWMSPHPTADVEIRLINADGSEAEISGNGTRCVAAYFCDSQEKKTVSIQTGAGLRTCILTARRGTTYEFETEMGQARVMPEVVLTTTSGEVRGIPVSIGNPHYVVFVPKLPPTWQQQAREIQASAEFPEGVNVEMGMTEGKQDITVRFFERGVGETQSSGTGSCASAVAAISTGRAVSPVRVHAPGGTQTVRQQNGVVFLGGPARLVCRGEFFPADFISDSA